MSMPPPTGELPSPSLTGISLPLMNLVSPVRCLSLGTELQTSQYLGSSVSAGFEPPSQGFENKGEPVCFFMVSKDLAGSLNI